MSLPTYLYFMAILFIGLPSALRVTGFKVRVRNATALAMVATWLFCRALYFLTGEGMPLQGMVISDMVVIATMFMKDDWITCPYANTRHQLACLWIERTPWDKAVLALFPIAWLFYAPIVDGQLQFWVLWGIGLAQLALAGHEALYFWLRANGQTPRTDNERSTSLEFAVAGRGYG